MTSRGVPGRRTRVGAALMSALGVLIALGGGLAVVAIDPAGVGTAVHADDPFSFD